MLILVMLVFLVFGRVVGKVHVVQCAAVDSLPILHKYLQSGNLIISALVSQSIFATSPKDFKCQPAGILSELFVTIPQNYQHILALAFAVKEINKNPQILPNLTLGFYIYDSYMNPRLTYRAALQHISPRNRFVPNYRYDMQDKVEAILEDINTENSELVHDLLKMYRIPQILYGPAPVMMDNSQLPSFYTMVPNETQQYLGILQLLLHFNWTWIGFFTMNSEILEWFRQRMFPVFSQHGICFAFMYSKPDTEHNSYMTDFLKSFSALYVKMLRSTANVIIVGGQARNFIFFRCTMLSMQTEYMLPKLKGDVWIVAAHAELKAYGHGKCGDMQIFHGMISVATHSNELQGFQEFFKSRKPSRAEGDVFLRDFWSYTFHCAFPNSVLGYVHQTNCTGDETLKDLPASEMSMTGHSYSIYNAVYAVACALHALHSIKVRHGERRKLPNQQPWQVAHLFGNLQINAVTS